jgi:hypothetical protein
MSNEEKPNFTTSLDDLWAEPKTKDVGQSTKESDNQVTEETLSSSKHDDHLPDKQLCVETPIELLRKLSFKKFIENVDITKRGFNSISAGLGGNWIQFESIGEYWGSSSDEQNILLKLPTFGKKSKSIFDAEIQVLLDNPSRLRHIVSSEQQIPSPSLKNNQQEGRKQLNCDDPALLAEIQPRLIDAISEKNFTVLSKRLINGETLEVVGKSIDVTRERVRQIEKSSLGKITKLLSHEINCLVSRLESLISEAGGVLSIDKCMDSFPEMNNVEFIVLLTAFLKNQDATLYRSKELIWLKNIYNSRAARDEEVITAFLSSHWPLTISGLASLLIDIPGPYIEYSLKNKYGIEINNDIIASHGKLKKQDQFTFVLRNIGGPAHVDEIKNALLTLFGTTDSLHNIEANLSRREDVLLAGSRTFCLYETLGISSESINEIRETAFNYINKVGDYVRANILCEQLFSQKTFDGVQITPYNLIGILQDDSRYITKPGLIIGLKTFGNTWQLQDAIEEIVQNYGPIHTREVLNHIPENRMVPEVTVSTVLRDHSEFIRVDPGTYDTIDHVFGGKSQKDTLISQVRNELVRQKESEDVLYTRHIEGSFQNLNHFAFRTLLERNFKVDSSTGKFGLN